MSFTVISPSIGYGLPERQQYQQHIHEETKKAIRFSRFSKKV
jgi:hypothetical protein